MKFHLIAALAATTALAGLVPGKAHAAPGDLYVSLPATGTIERITPGGAVSVFASGGVSGQEGSLAFDGSGNLYVTNFVVSTDASTIERITPDGAASVFASTKSPSGLAFDGSGNLYVANLYRNTIERFTPGGAASVFARGVGDPSGLAFDASSTLYVTDINRLIDRITPGGAVSTFAVLNEPVSLAFDAGGNLYAANDRNNTIVRFTPDGTASVFASTGSSSPFGLAFEPVVGPTAVPEPASLAVLAVGIAGFGLTRRKRVRSAGGLA